MPSEGETVAYRGEPTEDLSPGATGVLLAEAGPEHGHVLWSTGGLSGQVTITPMETLATVASPLLADSLDVPLTDPSHELRLALATGEVTSVIGALDEAGLLASMAEAGQEALEFLEARLRANPGLRQVMSTLDADDQDRVVAVASGVILTDLIESEDA